MTLGMAHDAELRTAPGGITENDSTETTGSDLRLAEQRCRGNSFPHSAGTPKYRHFPATQNAAQNRLREAVPRFLRMMATVGTWIPNLKREGLSISDR